jgi:hypothetical protein
MKGERASQEDNNPSAKDTTSARPPVRDSPPEKESIKADARRHPFQY